MLIDGFLTDTIRPSDNSLSVYCRQEGLDCRYLMAEISRKNSKKKQTNSGKKTITRKITV